MKGNLMILVCFLAGVFVGLGDFAPEWLLGHDLPIIILSLLIVQVGISLGSNNDLRGHARGGVSSPSAGRPGRRPSSPRSWGCFREFHEHLGHFSVFPTLVGVFL